MTQVNNTVACCVNCVILCAPTCYPCLPAYIKAIVLQHY